LFMSPHPLNNILFLDIETVPQHADFEELSPEWQELWTRKSGHLIKDRDLDTPASVYPSAGLYAEFGKIICISCGVISRVHEEKKLLIKSFYGDEERLVLQEFCDMIKKWGTGAEKYLCAHNGKEFDFPYLSRRLIVNGLCIPHLLELSGKKRWEIPHLDTMEMWKFGEYKNFTSLNLLALALGIPTPKDEIDGSMVQQVYWIQHDLPRIVQYCQKDVIAVAQVYLKLNNESAVHPDHIDIK